ncbi:JAB domain-containing protein [Caulobacter sp. DWR1-3-2b1]|uniref:JAB domain-containing protein n=1 Tax=Caulobacter sp. DWR1-3-2b1 TaxID=2804670 RepID=UPI003CFA3CC1
MLTADLAALSAFVDTRVGIDLQLIYDAARRLASAELPGRCVVSSWTALIDYLKLTMAHCEREAFRVLFLDKNNQLIADEILNHGAIDHAPVYPREIVRRALEVSASAVILVHNHPSGDQTSSSADIEMTRKIIDAARTLGIAVHGHAIVGRADVASFKALGSI